LGKQHKPRFDDECSQFLGQSEQAKMQWLQDPNQRNADKWNNARREAIKAFQEQNKGKYASQN
jgi:hypothetical protein